MTEAEFLKSPVYRQFRRVVVVIAGAIVLLIGIVLIVLPGPAIVVIPIGVSILALEFAWARRWKLRMRDVWQKSKKKFAHPFTSS